MGSQPELLGAKNLSKSGDNNAAAATEEFSVCS